MTRLAEVKAERDAFRNDAWTQHMCLLLALTTKPDHVERFTVPNDTFKYRISAYGLSRADGGYVVIRGIYAGQRDNITGYRFEDWSRNLEHWQVEFRIAAEHIRLKQNECMRTELNA